eukprot:TRINITY_DN22268_c0_g3_i1.p1 TRINITY_DN22268_c0_g3~~TRINITY_DN22268_c0_g3_i1.p1  ORF type:complete len:654 (+),score=279.32 TRINITY_DN22268_c0_g3_i1:76-1962(+)
MARRAAARFAGAAAAGFGLGGACWAANPVLAQEGDSFKAASRRLFDSRQALHQSLTNLPVDAGLGYCSTAQYDASTKEDVLHPIIDNNDLIFVAGAFFGDEGKGKTVDAIAHHPKVQIVVRVNSGENAGHTVFDSQGRKYVFHLAPSGLLIPGKINLVGPESVMDPISFFRKEVSQLVRNDIDYHDRLFIGNCHVVTPYHKLLDLLLSGANASTLKGMSFVHSSKVKKRGIRMDHLYNDRKVAEGRLRKDMEDYFACLERLKLSEQDVLNECKKANRDGVQRVPQYIMDFVTAKDKVSYLMDLYEAEVVQNAKFPKRGDVSHIIRETLSSGKKVLVEGPQSYWLSNAAEKFWESSTSAQTCAGGLAACCRYNISQYRVAVLNIHKAPGSSRVGVGANPSSFVPQDFFSRNSIDTLRDLPPGTFDTAEDFQVVHRKWMDSVQPNGVVAPDLINGWDLGAAMAIASSETHGECGATTKKPRVTGLFDCVAHAEVNQVQGPYLSISALDRGDVYDKLGLIVGYVYQHPAGRTTVTNGRVLKNQDVIRPGDALPTEEAMKHCHPIVKILPGWKDTPLYAGGSWWKSRSPRDPLPKNVCNFLGNIEHFTGAKVISIGNGPKGDQIIYIQKTRD